MDTAGQPTQELLLQQVGFQFAPAPGMDPALVHAAADIPLPEDPGMSGAGADPAGAPLTSVLASRQLVMEGRVMALDSKVDSILSLLQSVTKPVAPDTVDAPTNPGATVASAVNLTSTASPAATLLGSGVELTNNNFASHLPALDRQTKDFLTSGALLPHANQGKGAAQQQPYVLLPAHVVGIKGRREHGDGDEILRLTRASGSSSSSAGVVFSTTAGLPGNGKIHSADVLAQRLPTFQRWFAASNKVLEILHNNSYVNDHEVKAYQTYMEAMVEVSEDFPATVPGAWPLFLALDQDLRLAVFDKELSWAHDNGRICERLHVAAYAKLESLKSACKAPKAKTIPYANNGPAHYAQPAGAGPSYKDLMKDIPVNHRATCCVSFYTRGYCNRPACKFAATGHRCMICYDGGHGTAQHGQGNPAGGPQAAQQ
jgi:hypothetical protein